MYSDEQNIDILKKIKENHPDFLSDYNKILNDYSYKLMSRGICLYGMFWPDMELKKHFIYKGKLTKSETKRDFTYYFDENDRLLLTERYSDGELLNLILFYYYEDSTEIVWYCTNRKRICIVGVLDYSQGKLIRFLESQDCVRDLDAFIEYIFDEEGHIEAHGYRKK